jgi:hypothetical protein
MLSRRAAFRVFLAVLVTWLVLVTLALSGGPLAWVGVGLSSVALGMAIARPRLFPDEGPRSYRSGGENGRRI